MLKCLLKAELNKYVTYIAIYYMQIYCDIIKLYRESIDIIQHEYIMNYPAICYRVT